MLRISRRTFLSGASAMSLAAGVAADPGQAAAQPAGSGKLIIGLSTDPTTFQPYYFSIAFYHLYNQFYNVLVRLDNNQKPQPELAESWSLSPDGLKLSLNLRGDVMFQSGRKMTADDVRRSWERATSKDVNANSCQRRRENASAGRSKYAPVTTARRLPRGPSGVSIWGNAGGYSLGGWA